MGVFSNNRPNIVPGALISSSYVSDLYDLLSGAKPEAFVLSGSLSATGSLQGTASFAISASRSTTASFALTALTASYATYAVSASYEINYETSSSYAETASFATTASYIATASYSNMALSASYAPSAGSVSTTEYIQIPLSDETNSLTTGSAKYTFRMPFNMTLTEVRASATTAPSGSLIIVDINQSGTSILSTKLSIDENEKTSLTATTPAVISTSALVNDAEITLDIDQVGAPAATGKGLKILLKGTV